VTVLERQPRVGGKCCTVEVDHRTYDLGAVFGTREYTTTRELMQAVDLHGAPSPGMRCVDIDGHPVDLIPRRQYPQLLWALAAHYAWLARVRYRRVHEPGLAGIHPDLHEPFGRFAQHHGLPTLERGFAPPFTGFGYGYFDEVPAAYVLKYLDVPMLESLVVAERRFRWAEGAESLWARLAQQHDVRTGITVRRVARDGAVLVESDQGELEFDALVVTSPLDEALGFLDSSPMERRLFSAIHHYDYWVLLCDAPGLPEGSCYIPAHFRPDQVGHVMIWYHQWPGDTLCTLYALGSPGMSQETIEGICAADLSHVGATLDRVVDVRHWKYFPHVTATEMAAGFYNSLEAMQGNRHTYYAGEIMGFSTIELCARYSRALVERFFA
ncbi:MAG TPA: FAD-dependent oxidoreductase, partial [Candidatus Nanopelagicales bacterium]